MKRISHSLSLLRQHLISLFSYTRVVYKLTYQVWWDLLCSLGSYGLLKFMLENMALKMIFLEQNIQNGSIYIRVEKTSKFIRLVDDSEEVDRRVFYVECVECRMSSIFLCLLFAI